MRKLSLYIPVLAIGALLLVLGGCYPVASLPQPFTFEVDCEIPVSDYICNQTATPSTTRRFVIETVSFSGQASSGQTVGGNFNFITGRAPAFVWLPVGHLGPSPATGIDTHVATLLVRLSVDPSSAIRLQVFRNSRNNAYPFPPGSSPYVQRLNLMGYLE